MRLRAIDMTLKIRLEHVDNLLALLEGELHGAQGETITTARIQLAEIIDEKHT